ncbi:hypothetical protein [Nocardioides baculatus]|uniref:DUF4386 family protein n=1 Tax=Nocardioides baculatus TaxID=2801337 RepID=A0ABS1L6K0_9ACTN|nr:hypothetical protein [Nocardioides baculatus]MBL0747152.1 hypothetical protein [Nocardioides baculatus]
MSTTITTTNRVRSDVTTEPSSTPTRPQSRAWALAGLGAGVASTVATVGAGLVHGIYAEDTMGDDVAILGSLEGDLVPMTIFHVAISIAAVLLVVFAAGLVRRLRATMPTDSLVPLVAGTGVLATAVVWVMAGALDTEFIFGATAPQTLVPATAAVYGHWIGTVPGCTMLMGLGGLGVFAAQRRGGAPRWLGYAGLLLGGLTVVLGISPLQYMAGLTAALWLLVTGSGFAFGDRSHRRAA